MGEAAMPPNRSGQHRRARRAGFGAGVVGMILAAQPCGAAAIYMAQAAQNAPAAAPAPAKPVSANPDAAKPDAAKSQDAPGVPATVIDAPQVESLLGREVQSTSGENMGRIVDVLIDRTGQVRAAVIDFGGFLGVGSRKIAVDWHSIHFSKDKKADKFTTDLPSSELRTAPLYKEGEPVVVLNSPVAPPPKNPAPGDSSAAPPASK